MLEHFRAVDAIEHTIGERQGHRVSAHEPDVAPEPRLRLSQDERRQIDPHAPPVDTLEHVAAANADLSTRHSAVASSRRRIARTRSHSTARIGSADRV